MKIKKKNFVLGAMLTTCSLAVVGSITSTFAWYSYNTKGTLSFSGMAGGKTEYLQMKLNGEADSAYRTAITGEEFMNYSYSKGFANGSLMAPVTQIKGMDATGTSLDTKENKYGFYGAPDALVPHFTQNAVTVKGEDSKDHYVFAQADVYFKCVNPNKTSETFAKDIYISYIGVKASTGESKDVSEAVRIHISAGSNQYLLAPGYTTSGSTNLTGKLNLLGSQEVDAVDQGIRTSGEKGSLDATYRPFIKGYDDEADLEDVIYGNVVGASESYYGTNDIVTTFVDGKHTSPAKLLVTTTDESAVMVTITAWLEGWDPAINDANYLANFDFAIQFECDML